MDKKGKLKVFLCGAISCSLVIAGANYYLNKKEEQEVKNLNESFPKPIYGSSFNNEKTVEEYSFSYYGQTIKIQSDSIKIHKFDENEGVIINQGEEVIVEAENHDYLLDEYISENEAIVFKSLYNGNFETEFQIYLLFNKMEEVYEEYLNRTEFDTLESRKDLIYQIGYNFIESDDNYLIGNYQYQDLNKTIQKDILEIFKRIVYMKNHGQVQKRSSLNKFIDYQEKVINYQLFKKGR